MRCSISIQDALWVAGAGSIVGTGSAILTKLGNPVDGGLSIACFLRDCAGALGLHQTIEYSYLRPELSGIILAAAVTAMIKEQFNPAGGSSPVLRFIIGIILAFGVFAFVGCPMRTGLRLAGGDPAALAGVAGLIAGVGIGTIFLVNGFTLGVSAAAKKSNAFVIHVIFILFFVLLLLHPVYLTLSNQRHAPILISLAIGALVGIAGQRSKLCFTGGFRDFFLIRDLTLLTGFVFLVISASVTNILLGQEHFGTHIIGSSNALWSFIALCVVGIASVFLGGCPFRQIILAAQGNGDSTMALLGILTGAAIAYNMNLAYSAGSLDVSGKIAVSAGLAVLIGIGLLNREK